MRYYLPSGEVGTESEKRVYMKQILAILMQKFLKYNILKHNNINDFKIYTTFCAKKVEMFVYIWYTNLDYIKYYNIYIKDG